MSRRKVVFVTVNLDEVLGGVLGSHANLTIDEVEELLRRSTAEAAGNIETSFGAAGWYGVAGEPYEPPAVAFEEPPPNVVRTVEAQRRLWLSRYNPSDPAFDVPDIDDDTKFPWQHPEAAAQNGAFNGWWLSTSSCSRCVASRRTPWPNLTPPVSPLGSVRPVQAMSCS